MGNSPQQKLSVTYQHGTLQTDISNLQTSEVESLEINWSDASSQEEYTRCRVEILRLLESHKFPKVKRLVLNNLFYSEKLVKDLTTKFPNIGHLEILPFNSKNGSCVAHFSRFSALRKLEMTLGFSDDIRLSLPEQLKELTLSISKMASKQSALNISQCIDLSLCTSLESL